MSVTLSPSSQLAFQRPLTQLVKRTLSVSNHNHQAIAYKVKTTAPKQYCVRPNSGRIEPGETVDVQVLLQPMKEDPAPGAKCRDKFLVQSVIITPEREGIQLSDLWSLVEKEEKERTDGQNQIFEQKIRCAYLPAADNEANTTIPEETPSTLNASRSPDPDASFVSTINQGAQQPSAPSAASTVPASPNPSTSTPPPGYSAPTGTFATPLAEKARDAAAAASGAAAGAAAAVGLPGVANAIERNAPIPSSGGPAYLSGSSSSAAPATSTSSTTTTTTSASTGTDEVSRLRSELANAQAEIARLQKQLAASETTAATLRSRGAGAVDRGSKEAGTAQAVVELKGQEGVPVQVVAGIAFGVFVATWLFF
ncbi:phosphatidylinositol-binding protein scs2 [Rhodotorula kratochvilovae]